GPASRAPAGSPLSAPRRLTQAAPGAHGQARKGGSARGTGVGQCLPASLPAASPSPSASPVSKSAAPAAPATSPARRPASRPASRPARAAAAPTPSAPSRGLGASGSQRDAASRATGTSSQLHHGEGSQAEGLG